VNQCASAAFSVSTVAARKITRMFTVRQSVGALVSLAIIVGIAATIGYGIGVRVGAGPRMSETKVFRDVPASVGDNVMTAFVDNIAYGVRGEVPWVDASGSWHGEGWPACAPARSQSGSPSGAPSFMARRGLATTGCCGWTVAARGHSRDTPQ
jgi:hypothetical protein